MKKDEPKGHTCECCGLFHKWPTYVYAHWDVELTHKCGKCGQIVGIENGVTEVLKEGEYA